MPKPNPATAATTNAQQATRRNCVPLHLDVSEKKEKKTRPTRALIPVVSSFATSVARPGHRNPLPRCRLTTILSGPLVFLLFTELTQFSRSGVPSGLELVTLDLEQAGSGSVMSAQTLCQTARSGPLRTRQGNSGKLLLAGPLVFLDDSVKRLEVGCTARSVELEADSSQTLVCLTARSFTSDHRRHVPAADDRHRQDSLGRSSVGSLGCAAPGLLSLVLSLCRLHQISRGSLSA